MEQTENLGGGGGGARAPGAPLVPTPMHYAGHISVNTKPHQLCWSDLASPPGSFPLSTCRRKEHGTLWGFKPLTSGGSDRVPPIRWQNKSTWIHGSLKAWRTKTTQPKIKKE